MCLGSTSAGVSALPRSCTSAAKPTRALPGASRAAMSQTISVCTPASISGWYSARCGDAEQRVHFRQQPRQRAAIAQQRRPADGFGAASARDSSCHTRSAHQVVDFAVGDHARISASVSGATREAERREARQEARAAQDAHRVLGEGRRDVAQHARLEVARAAEGIDQRAVLVLGDRVDGEVAPLEVLFQRHRRIGVEGEAVVAGRGLALGARQRVFLARLADAGTPGSPCRPA